VDEVNQGVPQHQTVHFETWLESAPLGVYLIDHDFRVAAVNQQARLVFGDIPDLIGRDFDDVIHILWPKDYADEVSVRFRHTLETGEEYRVPERIEERRDRGEIEVYEWQISRVALLDQRYGVVCYFRDISASVGVRDALRASERRLRFVMDFMPQKVFTADVTGSVTYFNPQWSQFTGLTFEQIRDWGWTQFIHPDDLAENLRVWKEALLSGQPLLFDHRFRAANGEYRWHSSRVAPIHDDEGKVTMWIGSNTDIHDVMRNKEALEEVSRRKDDFLATVSHELRTPLTSILGWTALMKLLPLDAQTQEDGVLNIHRSALTQAELIDDLLDVVRVATGKLHLVMEPLDLNAVVRDAIAVVVPAAAAKGLQIDVSFTPHLPSIRGDATRLQQVIWNLLSNAAKFTPAGGTIAVRLFADDDTVNCVVSDTGVGMDREFLPYAFDRFAQQDAGASRRQGGLGLGLALVKQLVELHGGVVSARSEGFGQGSVFTVSLPFRGATEKVHSEADTQDAGREIDVIFRAPDA
jgi:PAS domain S-box-containing protein